MLLLLLLPPPPLLIAAAVAVSGLFSQSRSGSVLSQDLGSESYRKWSARAACMPAVPAYRTYHRPRVAPLTLTHVFSLKTRYFVAVKSQ